MGDEAHTAPPRRTRAWERALRPKPCRLASHRTLRWRVAEKLALDWSPEQISGWLQREFPADGGLRVAHETIYRSLFVQTRGVLEKELLGHLRAVRRMRQPKGGTTPSRLPGQIVDAASIRERPAEIVAHEVTNVGHDRTQLFAMATQVRSATGKEELTVVADRGYFSGTEILECDQAGMTPLVPKPLTSNSEADGRFDKRDFVYIAEDDEYRCPAGQRAIRRFTTVGHGMTLSKYRSSACPKCPLKAQCTTSNYRRIARWEHEAVLEAMQDRLDRQPDAMQLRRQSVEHPFGTLKAWMGSTHFLTKRLPRVSTEMSLHVLAYNLKRVMQILGIGPLMQAIRA